MDLTRFWCMFERQHFDARVKLITPLNFPTIWYDSNMVHSDIELSRIIPSIYEYHLTLNGSN